MARIIVMTQFRDKLQVTARFLTVGMLGTLIDLSLFAVFHVTLEIPTLAANTMAYSAGIINNFFFHRYWTFAQRPRKAAGKTFLKFVGVSLSALVLNNLIVLLLAPKFVTMIHDPRIGILLAKICAIGAGLGWNFLANYLWTFQTTPGLRMMHDKNRVWDA